MSNSIIEKQQSIARTILYKLEAADPHAILAGGAPRDWYLGNPCNDLDFYVHWPETTCSWERLRFERLGLEVKRMVYDSVDEQENNYKKMPDLFRVYEGEQDGVPFQIMVMKTPTFDSVVPMFGSSVCMAWWKGEMINTALPFLLSHTNKVMFIKDDYSAKELHVTKMKERFPNYDMLSFSAVETEMQKLARSLNCYPSEGGIRRALHNKENL